MQNERQKLVKELAKECTTVDDVHEKIRDLYLNRESSRSMPQLPTSWKNRSLPCMPRVCLPAI